MAPVWLSRQTSLVKYHRTKTFVTLRLLSLPSKDALEGSGASAGLSRANQLEHSCCEVCAGAPEPVVFIALWLVLSSYLSQCPPPHMSLNSLQKVFGVSLILVHERLVLFSAPSPSSPK